MFSVRIVSAIICLFAAISTLHAVVLFDDGLQNGATFYAGSGATSELSGSSDPVASGSHSLRVITAPYSQGGLGINRALAGEEEILELYVYRSSSGGDGSALAIRRESTWTAIDLDEANSDVWMIDGEPGHYDFDDDVWHLLQIDMVALGIGQDVIKSLLIKGLATGGTWFFDEVALVEREVESVPLVVLFDDELQNGASFYAGSGATSELSGSSDPVASGSHSLRVTTAPYSQGGLGINRALSDDEFLELHVYRSSGTGSGGKLSIRRESTWTAVDLDETNNAAWMIDGAPGQYGFGDDSWHVLQIDMAALGIDGEVIQTLLVKGLATGGTWFFDDVVIAGSGTVSIPEPPLAGDWTLTFEEDFDGDMLDPTRWRVGGQYLGMSGQGGIDPKQIRLNNGNLEIVAEKRETTIGTSVYDYATGAISTFQEFRQRYGYFEARMKYDAVQGSWPAFWMMPDRGNYGYEGRNYESFMRFDVSSFSQPVTQALLKLQVVTANDTPNVTVHRLLADSWSEDGVTYATRPAYDPEWLDQNSFLTAGDVYVADLTDYVTEQIAAGEAVGLALVDDYMRDRLLTFVSKEGVDSAQWPRLEIDGVFTLYPTDDATVRGDAYADDNFGQEPLLTVRDPWANTSSTYDGGMEMDIMESLGIWGPDVNSHALHWDGYGADHQATGSGQVFLTPTSDGYHTYGMYWEPGRLVFYTDGVITWEYVDERVSSVDSYMILSHQLGGWDGNQNVLDATLPATVRVDYVRVWSGVAE